MLNLSLQPSAMPLTALLTLALIANPCSADSSVMADAIKETLDAQVNSGGSPKASSAFSSGRHLMKTGAEEIVITQGYYQADILNSDNITIAFEVGSRVRGDIHCRILFHGGVVEREIIPCQSPIHLEGTLHRDGAYGFIANGTVARTNEPVRAVSTWGLDREPPETNLTDVKRKGSHRMKFTFTGKDQYGVAGYECSFDHGKWNPCTSPQTVNIRTSGQYCFEVRAVDYGGNVDASPIHYEWIAQMDTSNSSIMILSASEDEDHDHDHDHEHDHEEDHEHEHESSSNNSHSRRRVTGYIAGAVLVPTFFFVLCGVIAALRHGRLRSKLQYIADSPQPPKNTKKLSHHPIIYESGSEISTV